MSPFKPSAREKQTDTSFVKAFRRGAGFFDNSRTIKALPDGDSALLATSFKNSVSSVIVARLNQEVGVRWARVLSGPGNVLARALAVLPGEDWMVTGSADNGENNRDAFVAVITPEGGLRRPPQFFGGLGQDVGNAIMVNDGKITIAGETTSVGAGAGDILLFELNLQGTLNRAIAFGGPQRDAATSITTTNNGLLSIAAHTRSAGAGEEDILNLALDPQDWRVLSSTIFGGPGSDIPHGIANLGGEVVSIFGQTRTDERREDAFFAWLNSSDATLLEAKALGGSDFDSVHGIRPTATGFKAVGTTFSTDPRQLRSNIFVTDWNNNRELVAVTSIGNQDGEHGNSVDIIADGGVLVAGDTSNSSEQLTLVAKLTSDLRVPGCDFLPPDPLPFVTTLLNLQPEPITLLETPATFELHDANMDFQSITAEELVKCAIASPSSPPSGSGSPSPTALASIASSLSSSASLSPSLTLTTLLSSSLSSSRSALPSLSSFNSISSSISPSALLSSLSPSPLAPSPSGSSFVAGSNGNTNQQWSMILVILLLTLGAAFISFWCRKKYVSRKQKKRDLFRSFSIATFVEGVDQSARREIGTETDEAVSVVASVVQSPRESGEGGKAGDIKECLPSSSTFVTETPTSRFFPPLSTEAPGSKAPPSPTQHSNDSNNSRPKYPPAARAPSYPSVHDTSFS